MRTIERARLTFEYRNQLLLVVTVAGLGVAGLLLPRLPVEQLPVILTFSVIAAIAERYGTSLFSRTRVSGGPILVVAAGVIGGASGAVLPAIGIAFGSYLFRERPISRLAFNFGQQVLAAAAAATVIGLTAEAIGGRPGTIAGAALAGLTLWAISTPLVAAMIAFDQRESFWTTFRVNFAWLQLHFGFAGLIGYGLASSYLEQGVVGFAIFALPVFGFALAVRQGADKARPALSEAKAAREAATELELLLQQRDQLNEELRQSALHDALTGLPNRLLFFDRLEAACRAARDGGPEPAVAFVDLDRFKAVNDEYGHAAGDQLLRVTGERLRVAVEAGDTIARYGGDEFVVLLAGRPGRSFDAAAQHVLDTVAQPLPVRGEEVTVRASVGVSAWQPDDRDHEALMRRADIAVYRAKSEGRGRVVSYDDQVDHAPLIRRDLEQELRRALADGGLSVTYQPIVDLDSNAIRGFEALARWEHPERGSIDPTIFVPLAEETGQIDVLGRYVLRIACEQMRGWQSSVPNIEHLLIHVNVAPAELMAPGFVAGVREVLNTVGLPPSNLMFEVTEGTVLSDFDQARSALHQLSALGIGIALDDFGTGYSAMSYVHQLPLDLIKLDRSFVTELTTDTRLRYLVAGLHQVAAALGLDVVAEGIEREEDIEVLLAMGCRIGQGYFFAEPLLADRATELLRSGLPRRASEAGAAAA